MPLIKTTTEDKHYHVLYMRADGTGITTEAQGHVHAFVNGVMETVDGHTHGPDVKQPAPTSNPGEEKEETKKRLLRLYDEMKELEGDSRDKGSESLDFYNGKQWSDEDKLVLAKNRPMITINEVRSKINVLRGYQASNRTDIVYRPVESNDTVSAEIYTKAIKTILERNDFNFSESRTMTDAMITGRGVFQAYVDFDRDIEGEIKVVYKPWDEVYYGPHNQPDLSDCDVELHTKWMTLRQAKKMFPEHAEDIQESYDAYEKEPEKYHVRRTGLQYDVKENGSPGEEMFDMTRKAVRYLEVWQKEYERAQVAVNVMDDEYVSLEGWKSKDITALKSLPGFELVPRTVTRMRVTKMIADCLVSDEYPDLAENCFYTIPVYCYKDADGFHGLVEDMKDPQRIENKMFSQYTDILNKIASNGWFYDQQTFADKKEENKFKKMASTPGFICKLRSSQHAPVQVTPPAIPVPIANMVEQAAQKMREVSNINLDLQGLNSDAQSGVAIVEKKRQSLIGNAFLFDNLALAKKQLGRLLLRMLVKFYTPERLYRLLMGANAVDPVQLNVRGQTVNIDQVQPQEIMAALSNPDPAKLDVVVDESPFSVTIRRANFMQWAQMASNGVQVPPTMLIELSDLPNKRQAMEQMNQMAQAEMQGEKMKYDTEIQKAQIAAQSKMQGSGGPMPAEMGPASEAMPV